MGDIGGCSGGIAALAGDLHFAAVLLLGRRYSSIFENLSCSCARWLLCVSSGRKGVDSGKTEFERLGTSGMSNV